MSPLVLFALVLTGYAVGSQLAFSWFGADDVSASFFPAAGVTLAALVLVPRRQWPVVLIAAGLGEFTIDMWHGLGAQASAGYVVANLTQPIVGAALLLAVTARVDLGRTRDLVAFLGCAVVIAPAVGGAIGATTFVVIDGGEGWARFASQWWVGDGLGVLVVGGATLAWWSESASALSGRRALEGLAMTLAGTLCALAVLRADLFALVYAPIALFVVMAFRVGTKGVAVMGATLAIVVAESTAQGHTYWESLDLPPPTALVYLQIGMGVIIASALALAAEIAERDRVATALGRAEEERRVASERAALFESERTARKRAEALQQQTDDLQAVTAGLAAATSPRDVATVVVTQYIPAVGGLSGSIFALDEKNGVLRMVEHDSYPRGIIVADHEIALSESVPTARAAHSGRPVLLGDLETLRREYPAVAGELGRGDPSLGRAWAHIPLIAGGRAVGVLIIAYADPQPFDSAQTAYLATGADTIAQSFARSRLFALEQAARERAELLERHAAHLAAAVTVREVAESTIADLQSVGITIAVLGVARGDLVETVGASGIPQDTRARFARFPLAEPSLLTETLRTGQTIVIGSAEEYEARYPSFTGVRRDVGMHGFIGVPLIGDEERPFAALAVSVSDSAWLDAKARQLVGAIAEQTGLALGRALLFESERDARERAELLERNASHLADAESVDDVARSTLEDLALVGMEMSVIGIVDGDVARTVVASGVPSEIAERYPHLDLSSSTLMTETIRAGATIVVSSSEEYGERFPEALELRAGTGMESIMGAPLRSGDGRVLGALLVSSRERDWVDEQRRQLVTAVATQSGVALERAQLREAARADASNAQFIVELGDALDAETTAEGRAQRLVDLTVDAYGGFAAVRLDGDPTEPLLDVRTGEQDLERRRTVTVPLRARGRSLGTLSIGVLPDRRDQPTKVHLRNIAERAALSVDNALQYERERGVSHALQLSLLGSEPSGLAGAVLSTAYLPGTSTLEVGGDWYDAFELPNGALALVVGDVVGHGLEAAMAMGQLRGAVRALAPVGSPSEVLENLDAFVASVPEAGMTTLAYAVLDPLNGRFVYACAGHPPPLVVSQSGSTRFLWDGRSAPLGSAVDPGRIEADELLAPDEILLLYTDGLVERRDQGFDEMLARLLDASASANRPTPSTLVDRILATMLDGGSQADDVCLLALSRIPDRFTVSFQAAPIEVAALRHSLEDWLVDRGIEEDARRDLVLAVSEAAANAAEHAYGFDGRGQVDVDVQADGDSLRATISDRGEWRAPRRTSDRGRGTAIMHALMQDVTIDAGASGTIVRMRLPVAAGVAT